MSKINKRKFKQARIEFKKELFNKCKENKALAMLIIETYASSKHRRHIMEIWSMFRNPEFKNFQKAYNKNLSGKFLTGSSEVWKSIYVADRELHDKYRMLIPECYAMGDALAVAYRVLQS